MAWAGNQAALSGCGSWHPCQRNYQPLVCCRRRLPGPLPCALRACAHPPGRPCVPAPLQWRWSLACALPSVRAAAPWVPALWRKLSSKDAKPAYPPQPPLSPCPALPAARGAHLSGLTAVFMCGHAWRWGRDLTRMSPVACVPVYVAQFLTHVLQPSFKRTVLCLPLHPPCAALATPACYCLRCDVNSLLTAQQTPFNKCPGHRAARTNGQRLGRRVGCKLAAKRQL